MDLHALKLHLQAQLSDGLVIIIGSGLSCAEGIPGMGGLAEFLGGEVPNHSEINSTILKEWDEVWKQLSSGVDLETSLLKVSISSSLEKIIGDLTHSFILESEQSVLSEVYSGQKVLRLTKLLPHLIIPKNGVPIITPNYDRLIEIASEQAGLQVNNSFFGRYVAKFDPRRSRAALCKGVKKVGKTTVSLDYSEFVSVYKPHGSLDWYKLVGEPIRTDLPASGEKLIITPGSNKYRGGYERPFDTHRDMANKAIDSAQNYLVIGYGFNDEHLQVHLTEQLDRGKSAVVLTYSVSESFESYAQTKSNILLIQSRKDHEHGFELSIGPDNYEFEGSNIWDLENFVTEVLENE